MGQDVPDAARLAQIKLSLQEKLTALQQLDAEILELVDEDAVADEIEQADAFKEDVYAAMVKIDRLSLRTNPPSLEPPTGHSSSRSDPTRDSKVKLPKLTIQPFKGELTTWTTFWKPRTHK